ncbi:MBL fold metallo-hydrolase [Pseudomonas syringae]|nr:MBL fold metallo-hydrolase [Pseudomonas syringae]
MSSSIKVLPAKHGDCFLVSSEHEGKKFNLLIDGGPSSTFSSAAAGASAGPLKKILTEIIKNNEVIDLAILTHIDSDHIGGFLKAFQSKTHLPALTKKIWFNASSAITTFFGTPEIQENTIRCRHEDDPNTSAKQAQTLESYLAKLGIWNQCIIIAKKEPYLEGPFKITVLSPTPTELKNLLCIWPLEENSPKTTNAPRDHDRTIEELYEDTNHTDDTAIANGSSIAFILESKGKKVLFLGDAFTTTIIDNLKKIGYCKENQLKIEHTKISHHGSRNNTSLELLEILNCRSFIISTNGSIHRHPDKAVIAKILKHNSMNVIHYNYESAVQTILSDEEKKQYGHRLKFITNDLAF